MARATNSPSGSDRADRARSRGMASPFRTLTLLGLAVILTACLTACSGHGNQGGRGSSGDVAPIEIVTKSGVAMVSLPAGSFMMGSDQGNPDEAPPHKISVSAFLMDKYPVTNEMYQKAQVPNPSHWQDSPKQPVERVRWRDAKLYCNERSRLEGLKPCYNEKTPEWDCDYTADGYRLPTEAEWEYAARAGTTSPYEFGSSDKAQQFAWIAANAEQKTHAVGQKKPNAWGLYDMYGNVSEWCEDVYSPTWYAQSPSNDPTGPPSPG